MDLRRSGERQLGPPALQIREPPETLVVRHQVGLIGHRVDDDLAAFRFHLEHLVIEEEREVTAELAAPEYP